MFQRLKGAIDSRIAEEQARQKSTAASGPPARSSSTVKRTNSRTESPATKPRRPRPKDDGTSVRGPDPAEFENAFVVEDEPEELPKAGTPAIPEEKGAAMAENDATAAASGSGEGGVRNGNISPNPVELPAEVRTKLRKLEKLESKYQELLRSYRVAHAKAVSIEPFEKALRENTPLVSITDPDAFLEYINQINSKGDMVMDEYKRVSSERNDYKKKFEDADKEATIAQEELVALKRSIAGDGATEKTDTMSMDTPTASVKSPVSSVLGIFSPKQKAESADCQDVGEEFFSYDDEVPKLQSEVQQRTDEVEKLKSKVCALENDLATAEESRSALVMDLEKATEDLEKSKNPATEGQPQTRVLTDKLQATELQLSTLKADLAKQKTEAEEKVTILEGYIANYKENANRSLKSETQSRKEAEETRQKLEEQIKELEDVRIRNTKRLVELSKEVKSLTKQVEEKEAEDTKRLPTPTTLEVPAITAGGATSAAKRKNKKKKKGGNGAFNASGSTANDGAANTTSDFVSGAPISMDLQVEVERLREEVANRDNQISKLQTKRMTEADLREELENMQDKIKQLQQEKIALEEKIEKLESEIDTYKNKSKDSEKMEVDFKTLAAEFEDLKIKSASLQSDLEHSEKLASTRFKDLSDLREVLQKAQPELKTLRTEHANMKATKDELAARTSDLRRLEAREKDLKSDIASFKKQAADSQVEIRTLNEKVIHETNSRLRAEDQNRVAQRDMRKSEAEKIQLAASGEKSAAELAKVQEDAGKLRTKVRELEAQLSKLTSEANGLREEVELRGSQYNNAQGLLGSMRDQAGEMAMQLKEAKDQSESLEQELGEIQRLLSERTREGETMRRLLADVDDRADAKVREMRERMETAIEERDRAEDEASTNGRKRAREAEELKGKIRDVEKELKRATDEREDLLRAEKEWKRKRDELESTADHATKEAGEIRSVMSELRDALDGSEKQIRSAENQRAESRRLLDEANQRYEKLQKEFKMLQAKQTKLSETSSRSSTDSRPVSVNGNAPAASGAKMDYVYLKTILLQFLEQRDKKRQADLVKTVLGQLLQFDKKDQDRWIAAISAK